MSVVRMGPRSFNSISRLLRSIYSSYGLEEVYTSNLYESPLSACESSRNIVVMNIGGQKEAVAQTQQMNLEVVLMENYELASTINNMRKLQDPEHPELLSVIERLCANNNPKAIKIMDNLSGLIIPDKLFMPRGYHTFGTSFRDEKIVGDGRHSRAFLMSEFEATSSNDELAESELAEFITNLLVKLGFEEPKILAYDDICRVCGVDFIGDEEETAVVVSNDYNPVLISDFPERSDPFWNMCKKKSGNYAKFDIILPAYNKVLGKVVGLECGGTAVRSCNTTEMLDMFQKQDNGNYANTLYKYFGKERIDEEMEKFMKNRFISRFGGGIGVERLLTAMEWKGISYRGLMADFGLNLY